MMRTAFILSTICEPDYFPSSLTKSYGDEEGEGEVAVGVVQVEGGGKKFGERQGTYFTCSNEWRFSFIRKIRCKAGLEKKLPIAKIHMP